MQNNFGEIVRLRDVWPEFERSVTSDAVAADVIYQTLEGQGAIVCRCSCANVVRVQGSRIFKCSKCKHETWITAKTVLKRTTNLRAWLAAIYLKQNRVVITPSQLARLTEISPTGAYEIHAKLNLVVCGQIAADAWQVQSELFRDAICKRSRETPARLHPVAEELSAQELYDEGMLAEAMFAEEMLEDIDHSPDYEAAAAIASGTLGTASGALPSLGDRLNPSEPAVAPLRLIVFAIGFIKRYCHGISRKYLQLYLAGFCFQFLDVEREPDSLLKACLVHPPISYNELLNYVTPIKVQLPWV